MATRPSSTPNTSYYANARLGLTFSIPESWSVKIDERVVDKETNERNIDFVFTLPNQKQGGFVLIVYENPKRLLVVDWLDETFASYRKKGSFPYELVTEKPAVKLGNTTDALRVIGFPEEGKEPAFLTFAGNYYAVGIHVYRFLWLDRGDDVYEELTQLLLSITFN
ncbi:MAG: hypothetical protein Q8R11_00025 [bacterium]|nr:hypothetical protein [bacterium]